MAYNRISMIILSMKYPQPHNLRKYFDDWVVDMVHNTLKHGEKIDLKKYQVFLRPIRKRSNKHKTSVYR